MKDLLFLVNKVASSSLARLFIPYIKNSSYDQDLMKLHAVLWRRAGKLSYLNGFQNTNSFVISRHPFTRIVSAYRNKFQTDTKIDTSVNPIIQSISRAICVAARQSGALSLVGRVEILLSLVESFIELKY